MKRSFVTWIGSAVCMLSVLMLAGCPGGIFPPINGNDNGSGNVNDNTNTNGGDTLLNGTLTATVINALSGQPIANATIAVSPSVLDGDLTTDADGKISQQLPIGYYDLTITDADELYESGMRSVVVFAQETTDAEIELTPKQNVALSITVDGDAAPGATVSASVDVQILDGTTTVTGYSWSQSNSVEVTLSGATSATPTITLPSVATYKDELITFMMEPPVSQDQLPDNVVIPETEEGEFPGGLADRFDIVGVNPFAIEKAGLVTLEVEVVTSSGTYTAETEIHAHLPWYPSLGIRNVPLGEPVLFHGKEQASYDWDLDAPSGSSATLTDAGTRNPYFTPDATGMYTVTVTDTTGDADEVVTFEIYAGRWQGAITGQNADGTPRADNCTVCHKPGGFADGNQFNEWAETGHAMIFTDQINYGDHYASYCLPCHTVGYNTDVANGGFDDASDYDELIEADLFHETGDDIWDQVLSEFPDTALRANVQCENCHGPQFGGHTESDARISIRSDVCARCHGEPLRHGRFQQWQLSGHANYETAIAEGTSSSCATCHSGNGFLQWVPLLLDNDPDNNSITVDWEEDEIHPITCVACHDPHNIGTVSGDDTDATVRITGDTPLLVAGFTARGVGSGAICMTCHNSRRGLRNDDIGVPAGDESRAPHGSSQSDVLMGQNAYFVQVGVRGNHSLVENTCVNCHMQETAPPDLLAYNQGGTNHTFAAADDICANCHGASFGAAGIQDAFASATEELLALIEEGWLDAIEEQIAAGNYIVLTGDDGDVTVTDASTIDDIEFGESHGRQAITVTFTDDSTAEHVRLERATVFDNGDNEVGHLAELADARLIKAGWNYNLAVNDGSRGVHNPSYVFEFLDAAIDQLVTLAAE